MASYPEDHHLNIHCHHNLRSQNIFDNTYLLTPWSRVLLEKLTGSAASQEIPHIFGTRRFLTVPTSARKICCVILPLETLAPGDPSGGVVYLRIVLSPEEASRLVGIS